MKKMVSLIGVGAMVMMIGLSSSFAQQQTADPKSTTAPQVKEQVTPEKAKPGLEVKSDKTTPATPASGKTDDKMVKAEGAKDNAPGTTVAPAKPDEKVPGPAVAPAKPEVKPETKADTKDLKKDSTAKADEKTDGTKPVKQ